MAQTKETTTVLTLANYWPYQVTVLADRIARQTASIVRRYDLNLSQWRVLAAVADGPGRTSVDVVNMTPMDKGIVSRATKALLEMGLLRREASQKDGRVSHLYMTDLGATIYRRILPQLDENMAHVKAHFNAQELEALTRQLEGLLQVWPTIRP